MAFTFLYTHTHIYTVTIQENYCQWGDRYSGSILVNNDYFSVTALNHNLV